MSDLYEILGLPSGASADEIKRAYRRLAREHHPDANQGDEGAEDRFKEISRAYETLSDPERRRHYDMFGEERAGAPGPGPGGFGVGIDDIFDAFFGGSPFGASRRSGPMRRPPGDDLVLDCRLEFTDAIFGTEEEVEIRVKTVCHVCDGSGAAAGTHPDTCATCGGRGEVQQARTTMLGQIVTVHPCPHCDGHGIVIASPCSECRGDGRTSELRSLTLKIPGGVDDGAQLRLAGRGDAGPRGGPPGDLYVRMRVAAAPAGWTRDGADLHYALPTPMTTATLGGTLEFTTLEDEVVEVDIKAGTQPGSSRRLRGKGADRLNRSGRGDLHVDLHIQTPADLTTEQVELIVQLAEIRGENTESAGVVKRIKQAFR